MNVFIYNKDHDFSDSLFCEEIDMTAEDGEKFVRHADVESQLAALREELAEIKESTAYRGSLLGRTEQRLADAERRNAECMALLAETSKSILRHQAEQPMSNRLAGLLTKARAKVDRYLKAALNPNPEAASHDE